MGIIAMILNIAFWMWWLYLLVDCWKRPTMSTFKKVAWTAFIVLVPPIGTLGYFIVIMLLRSP